MSTGRSHEEITMRPLTAREEQALAAAASDHERHHNLYQGAYGREGAKGPDAKTPDTKTPDAKAAPQTDAQIFQKLETQLIKHQNSTAPVEKGEGYYQVLGRMHKDWSGDHINKEAHRLKDINQHSDHLKIGQRLSLISDAELQRAVKDKMAAFEHANPQQRKEMLAEARRQVLPEIHITHGPVPKPHQIPLPIPRPQV